MVAVEELLLYFLAAPALAYAGAVLWVRRTMRWIAERELGFLRRPGVLPRFLVFSVLLGVPIVFGLTVFMMALRIPEDANEDAVVRALGGTWALTSILTVLSQAWMVVRRGESSFGGPGFARVLVLCVIPVAVIDFLLVIAFIVVGRVRLPRGGSPLSYASASVLLLAIEYMAIGSVSGPLSAFLSNRVASLEPGRYTRALALGVAGLAPGILAIVLAMAQLGAVR